MDRRTFLVAATVAAVALATRPAFAGKAAVFTGLVDGVGVGGYDPVAYFTQQSAVPGDPAISAVHDGVTYRFASAEHRDAFLADPQRYLPQFGGYCAYAVAQGATAKGDPEAWTVHDGKLYLNYSDYVRAQWSQDIPGNISKAQTNWPGVLE